MNQRKLTSRSREKIYHSASKADSEISLKGCLLAFSCNTLQFQLTSIHHRWSIASHCSHCPAPGNLATIVFARQPDTRHHAMCWKIMFIWKQEAFINFVCSISALKIDFCNLLQVWLWHTMTVWPNCINSHVHEAWCPPIRDLLSTLLTPLQNLSKTALGCSELWSQKSHYTLKHLLFDRWPKIYMWNSCFCTYAKMLYEPWTLDCSSHSLTSVHFCLQQQAYRLAAGSNKWLGSNWAQAFLMCCYTAKIKHHKKNLSWPRHMEAQLTMHNAHTAQEWSG